MCGNSYYSIGGDFSLKRDDGGIKMNNNYIEIRLINTGECGVSLRDTSGRTYNVPLNGQLRISLESFKSILDNPVSKRMICKGMLKPEGITEEMLYGSILSDEERDYILGKRICEVEESKGVETIELPEEEREVEVVKAITFYNWIKNEKADKIKEAIKNPVNYDTLKDIIAKNDKYDTEFLKNIMGE